MDKIKKLEVRMNDILVGRLIRAKDNLVSFSYDQLWLEKGFSISPISLPLIDKIFIPKSNSSEGLFGIFADSLPDAWGRTLVDKYLTKRKESLKTIEQLNRLAIVGKNGKGCLEYYPEEKVFNKLAHYDCDILAKAASDILHNCSNDKLDSLFQIAGNSRGTQPKIFMEIDGEEWIVKFLANEKHKDDGKMEFDYYTCAKECGIEISESKLISSKNCDGYFATKRFDRIGRKKRKVHVASASALLETFSCHSVLDYKDIFLLTKYLTRNFEDIKKLYKLMCFNVFAHNRDDHGKKISYIYDELNGRWQLSPAYDLRFSTGVNDRHVTYINGNGLNPEIEDVVNLAEQVGLNRLTATEEALGIKATIEQKLECYLKHKKEVETI